MRCLLALPYLWHVIIWSWFANTAVHVGMSDLSVFRFAKNANAGWTTANPTIYRAGLAFQAIIPKTSTFWVTIIAGTVATIAGLFPAFAVKLLVFEALYGFILAPFGAIIVFEHYFYKQAGIVKNYAEVANISFNKSVFLAWALSFGSFYFTSLRFDIFLSLVALPPWLLCGVLFLVFSRMAQKKSLST